jgi:hypothetical protein
MQPHIRFNWKAPTTRTDGTPLTPEEIAALEYLLFESMQPVDGAQNIGEPTFSLLMDNEPEGPKSYTVAARGDFGLIGPHSEPHVVNFTAPAAPTDLVAEWVVGSETSVSGSVG